MQRAFGRVLWQQRGLPSVSALRAGGCAGYTTFKRQKIPEYYGLRAIKKRTLPKEKEDSNPFDPEVGTWHEDKWYPPGVTEFNSRTMDRWNDSPYDPPEVTHDFMKETSGFLLDWKHPRTKIVYMNRAEEMNSFDSASINRVEELLFKYGNQDRTSTCTFFTTYDSTAFSTGTNYIDVLEKIKSGKESERAKARKFFLDLYSTVMTAHDSRVPLLTMMDGLTLGSAATIGVSSPWAVVTDRSTLAWTEVGFGFFPDAGATFFLSKLPKYIGTYLALTGSPIRSSNAVKAGLAAHALDPGSIEPLRVMIEDIDGMRSPLKLRELISWVDERDANPFSLLPYMDTIETCFSKGSVKEIMAALEEDGSEWAIKRLDAMKAASPLSLAITLRAIRNAEGFENLGRSLKQDFLVAMRMLDEPDFVEGVEKKIMGDEQPVWRHASVEEVSEAEVDKFFAPFTEEEEKNYAVAPDDRERQKFLAWRQYAVNHRARRPRQYPSRKERLSEEVPEDPEVLEHYLNEMHNPAGLLAGIEEQLTEDPSVAEFYRNNMKLEWRPPSELNDSEKILSSASGIQILSQMTGETAWDEPEFKGKTWRTWSHKDAHEALEEFVSVVDPLLGIEPMLAKDKKKAIEALAAKFHAEKN